MRTTKKLSTKCDTFCKDFVKRQIKRVKTFRKRLAKTFKGVKGMEGFGKGLDNVKIEEENMHEQCKKGYCNEDCKDTLFQDGSLPPSIVKSFEGTKAHKALFKTIIETQRKEMFGKKKSVLKDSFYEGLTDKDVKRLKKEGATSGCTLMAL
jgi:hypothetical protein